MTVSRHEPLTIGSVTSRPDMLNNFQHAVYNEKAKVTFNWGRDGDIGGKPVCVRPFAQVCLANVDMNGERKERLGESNTKKCTVF